MTTKTVEVPVKVPCIDRAKLPPRPKSVADPSSDVVRLASGIAADLERSQDYADQLEAAMVGCFSTRDGEDGEERPK